ncbi:hypothetical protein J416_09189 [Gracilibacillus halophilus YIM-C55.5]|uniref:Tyr recombinase domain-containing protein n=1 Tax=Gracilibacillus halophilus YIM-C55.5 TaxID=1308866 RepID=N4WQK5_9BACI|nr:tyrosine-type recombinase/integrase [Gracilibacillus halophilus]ENH96740.1 hypothetical protein J416_09189 [Gracilibacillus halophilus YIM-C55.5]
MLNIDDIMNRFFEQKSIYYLNHVNAFIDYLKHDGMNVSNMEIHLQGIRSYDIIKSLDFYIEKNNITAIDTAQRYSSAVKEFLLFLYENYQVTNQELNYELYIPPFKDKSYRGQVNKHINKLEKEGILNKSTSFQNFDTLEINNLLNECNQILNSRESYLMAQKKQVYFNKYRSAIMIKIILLMGITYREIIKMKINDISLENNYVKINGFIVRIPINLLKQLRQYINLLQSLNTKERIENLFIEFNGDRISSQTSTTSNFINSLLGRGDLTGLIKYITTSMINEGINETIIKQVTGISDVLYSECHNIVYNSARSIRHFDSKIRNLEMFDQI